MPTWIELAESSSTTLTLADADGRLLAGSGVVTATPSLHPGRWTVTAGLKVGALRVGEVELRIRPKVPVARLLFLAGYGHSGWAWRPETVGVDVADDLVPAVAGAYALILERALRQGVLQGYQTRDDTSTVLRGRLREADQLRRHHGLPLPLEVRHDEFTVDIPENRLLLGVALRMARLADVPAAVRRRLAGLVRRLADVSPPVRGTSRPTWTPTRLNVRFQPALRMAELLWDATSPESGAGRAPVAGFVFDMWAVFEGFLHRALREQLSTRTSGRLPQVATRHLDQARRLGFRPDFLWTVDGRPAAVVDAKYKTSRPIDDVYQVLAYCTALGLRRGHLVYAIGDPPSCHAIRGSDIEIFTHVVDLDTTPDELLGQVSRICDSVSEDPTNKW